MANDPDRRDRGRGRGRPSRNRLSREEIVQAALEIAEEEGIKAVSMRKVARRLNAGTMSLYHYVRTKDDLLALMDDAIMGEIVIPEGEMPEGWRERVALIARMSIAAWMKRPWLIDIDEEDGFRISENGLQHMEQTIGALEGLDISPAHKFEIMSQVDDYIFGFAVRERKIGPGRFTESEDFEELSRNLETMITSGDYPQLSQMFDRDKDFKQQWMDAIDDIYDGGRFDRGLNRLLDGIEVELTREGALPADRPASLSSVHGQRRE